MCPRKLAVYLKEQPFISKTEICERAERYLQAHNQTMTTDNQVKPNGYKGENAVSGQQQRKDCFNCGKSGHTRAECRSQGGGNEQKCNNCNMFGHLEGVCWNRKEFAGMMNTRLINNRKYGREQPLSSGYKRRHHGKKEADVKDQLGVAIGRVNDHTVSTPRDTGCTTVCVNKKFVLPEQLTGRYKTCQLMDGTEKRFETATISIDTPYIKHG